MQQWNKPESKGDSTLSFMVLLAKMMMEAAKQDRELRYKSRVNEYETSMKSVEKQKDAARLQFIAGITSASAQIAAGTVSMAGSIKAGKIQKQREADMDKQFKLAKPKPKIGENKVKPTTQNQGTQTADKSATDAMNKVKPQQKKTDVERMEAAARDIRKFNEGADFREAHHATTNEVRATLQKAEGASMLAKSLGEAGSAGAKWMSDLESAEAKALDALAKFIGHEGTENSELYQAFKSSTDNIRNIFKSISDSRHSTMSHVSKA